MASVLLLQVSVRSMLRSLPRISRSMVSLFLSLCDLLRLGLRVRLRIILNVIMFGMLLMISIVGYELR